MSRYSIKPENALPMLRSLAAASRKWGKQASAPFSMYEIMQAIEIADERGFLDVKREEVISKEEVTLLRRQLAACQNREKARKGRVQDSTVADTTSGNGDNGDV